MRVKGKRRRMPGGSTEHTLSVLSLLAVECATSWRPSSLARPITLRRLILTTIAAACSAGAGALRKSRGSLFAAAGVRTCTLQVLLEIVYLCTGPDTLQRSNIAPS